MTINRLRPRLTISGTVGSYTEDWRTSEGRRDCVVRQSFTGAHGPYGPQAAWPTTNQSAITLSGTPTSQATE
jgi:hypothetical protein